MGKKNIPPSLFYPVWREPWPEFRFRWILWSRRRQTWLFCVHHFKFPSWTCKVRFWVWGRQLNALGCRPGAKTQEKTWRVLRRQREKQAKCDCAVESCSPRFIVILGITTLFNNSGRTGEGRIKNLQQAKNPWKWRGGKEFNNTRLTRF